MNYVVADYRFKLDYTRHSPVNSFTPEIILRAHTGRMNTFSFSITLVPEFTLPLLGFS